MRVFLAGATGVLGRRIVGLLVAEGHQVTALTRNGDLATDLRAAGADPIIGDAMNSTAMRQIVAAARCDVVMDQLTDLRTGDSSRNASLRTIGTRNLIDAALAAGVERVVAQSIAWAYEPGALPAVERTPLDTHALQPRRTTIDGVTALEATVAQVRDWVVLRYGTLYGPDTWYSPAGDRAQDARAGQLVADAGVTSFVHVDDAAVAAVQALEWPTGAVNICDDVPAAGHVWVPVFYDVVGAAGPVPADSAQRATYARGADNSHARRELGWTPLWRSWRDGFAAMSGSQPAAGVDRKQP